MVKNPLASAGATGDAGSTPGRGRSLGGGNGKYSCQVIPTDRGAWQATVHGVAESDMTEHTHTHDDN